MANFQPMVAELLWSLQAEQWKLNAGDPQFFKASLERVLPARNEGLFPRKRQIPVRIVGLRLPTFQCADRRRLFLLSVAWSFERETC